MKKSLFFALAVAGMLSSCSSEDAIGTDVNVSNEDLVPIQLGLTNSVITRGAGTVGGVTEEENVWKNQTVNVFMLKQGTLDEAEFKLTQLDGSDQTSEKKLFYNTPMYTPNGVNSAFATRVDGLLKYYPTQGNYDFWAYHVDEFDTTEPAVVSEPAVENNYLYVNVKLDGSQDVMVAKAVPTPEEIAKLEGYDTRYYSAFAARRDVQPAMKFKHLLSRLQFNVEGGNSSACAPSESAVSVKDIIVKSLSTGKLVVAYTGEEMDQLIWDEGQELVPFFLKQRATGENEFKQLEALTPVPLALGEDGQPELTRVGEALLVAPAEKYEMTIVLSQNVQVNEDGTYEPKEFTYTTTLAPKNAAAFVKGSSYNVNITIFGLSEIKITTTLAGWEDGEDIPLKPEDDNIN